MRPNRSTLYRRLAALALPALLAIPPAAHADWLVTREGARIETAGPWSVRGKLVVFKLAKGDLSSMRVEQVDLAASQATTAQAKARQQEEKAAAAVPAAERLRRKSVLVLTDKDFKKVTPPGEPAAPGETAEGEGGAPSTAADGESSPAPAASSSNALEIAGWERVEESGFRGVSLVGTLRNNTSDTVTEIDLQASLYDETGNLIARVPAELETAALGPGESAGFTVRVEGTYTFAAVKFQARGGGFRTRSAPEPAPAAEEAPR
jgi:hypothetical protein